MKKTFIVLSAIMILSNANVFAYGYGQEKENVVGIHFFSLFYSNIHLKYERVIGENISGVMNVGFMPSHEPPKLFTEGLDVVPKLSGWSLTPEFRYYPGNNNGAPKGFYLAPYMRIDKYTFSIEEVYYNDLG